MEILQNFLQPVLNFVMNFAVPIVGNILFFVGHVLATVLQWLTQIPIVGAFLDRIFDFVSQKLMNPRDFLAGIGSNKILTFIPTLLIGRWKYGRERMKRFKKFFKSVKSKLKKKLGIGKIQNRCKKIFNRLSGLKTKARKRFKKFI